MFSNFFTLNKSDLIKGAVVAGLTAFFGAILSALNGNGLDVASYNWQAIIEITVVSFGSYLTKNLFTTADGKFMGVVDTKQ